MAVLSRTPATIRRVEMPHRQLVGFIVQAQHDAVPIRRFFSDLRFGGKRRALALARAFANQLGRGDEFVALLRRLKPRRNSRSGLPGVARYDGHAGRGAFWLAYWDENGRKIQKKFAVSAHGEEQARALAVKARQKAVKAYEKRLTELRKHDARLLGRLGQPAHVRAPRLEQQEQIGLAEAETARHPAREGPLTRQQLRVLELLVQGRSNEDIARALGVSVNTVRVHLAAIYRSLGAHTRSEAVLAGRHLLPQ